MQFIFFVKTKANSTIEQEKCKGHEKNLVDLSLKNGFHFSDFTAELKINLMIQFSQFGLIYQKSAFPKLI